MHKDLFTVSHKKNQFFEAAKQMMNSNVLADSSNSQVVSYKKFYERCQKQGILAMPMFSNAQN